MKTKNKLITSVYNEFLIFIFYALRRFAKFTGKRLCLSLFLKSLKPATLMK